jgi:hypothetical protein
MIAAAVAEQWCANAVSIPGDAGGRLGLAEQPAAGCSATKKDRRGIEAATGVALIPRLGC